MAGAYSTSVSPGRSIVTEISVKEMRVATISGDLLPCIGCVEKTDDVQVDHDCDTYKTTLRCRACGLTVTGSASVAVRAWNGARPAHKIEHDGTSMLAEEVAEDGPVVTLLTEIRDTLQLIDSRMPGQVDDKGHLI